MIGFMNHAMKPSASLDIQKKDIAAFARRDGLQITVRKVILPLLMQLLLLLLLVILIIMLLLFALTATATATDTTSAVNSTAHVDTKGNSVPIF